MKIAFIGKIGSGKTTAARYLVEKHGFVKLSFADPLKIATAQMLNQLQAYLHIYGVREIERRDWTLADIDEMKSNASIRHLIQLVGTELGRELIGYEDVWLDMLLRDAEHLDNVVVDDVRFKNEAFALEEHGFTLVRVVRPFPERFSDGQHISETNLDYYETSITINNAGDIRFFQGLDDVKDILAY